MRLAKILIIFLLVVVTALYGMTLFTRAMDHSGDIPSISCDSDTLELSVQDDESVLLTGITAKDRQDGDLTDEILISGISKFLETGTANVSYLVFDSDHNVAFLTRTIRYTDYESPQLSITAPLVYKANEDVALLDRIQVTDCIDGDITSSVRVSAPEALPYDYIGTITIQVNNSMGDSIEQMLPIVSYPDNGVRPEIVLTQQLVYLSQGSDFRASDYVSYINTPAGVVSKSAVSIDSDVNTEFPGTYMVRYNYSYAVNDALTRDGVAVLTVVVE